MPDTYNDRKEPHMGGITAKITDKVKQATGDITNDGALRREGLKEERKGEAQGGQAREGRPARGREGAQGADFERKTSQRDRTMRVSNRT
jgi:uncharacterized protein YjbJ (UPF0337 family)